MYRLLRLLGAPKVRLAAAEELQSLEPDAVEHQVAYEWLLRLHSDLKKTDPATLSNEEQEFVMGAWLEERDRQLVQSAVEKTRLETQRQTRIATRIATRIETRIAMLRPLLEMRLGRALTRTEVAALRQRVRQEQAAERLVVTIASQWTQNQVLDWLKGAA